MFNHFSHPSFPLKFDDDTNVLRFFLSTTEQLSFLFKSPQMQGKLARPDSHPVYKQSTTCSPFDIKTAFGYGIFKGVHKDIIHLQATLTGAAHAPRALAPARGP
jgi:hypothetical protein